MTEAQRMEKIAGVDWDSGNLDKCRAHGVSTAEIETALHGDDLRITPDEKHSRVERRFRAIGRNASGRYVFVVFTIRRHDGRAFFRPISARYMHAKEIAYYETEDPRV